METMNQEFDVHLPIDRAWAILTDIERIAPCMPGAQLEEIEGNEFRGGVKIKVGPITAMFKGKAVMEELDNVGHKAVIKGEGRDTGGKGNASAHITATAQAVSDGLTRVQVSTQLNVTGKVAQFGRGAMSDISNKLLGQFVDNLHELIEHDKDQPAAAPAETHAAAPVAGADGAAPTIKKVNMTDAKPVDLLDAAGAPLLKRLAPLLGALFFLFVIFTRRRKRRA
jgi:carbon monoxide dehydrogenase subunit G